MKQSFLLFFLFVYLTGVETFAQKNNEFSKERRIYLWDVTLSMKGYKNKTPNIWDKVVSSLCENINNIMDEDTEIIVLPYQERILERWVYNASKESRKQLINMIKNYNNNEVTNTNIYTPFKDVVDNYLKSDNNTRNVVFLLTDGQHNVHNPSVSIFHDYIKNWCKVAISKNAYAFYITLTEFAKDETLSNIIKNTCQIKEIPYTDTINFLEFSTPRYIKYNVKDDKDKLLSLNLSISTEARDIPSDIKFHVKTDNNNYIYIDEVCTLNDKKITFKVKHLMDDLELKKQLPTQYNQIIKLSISLTPETQLSYPLILLTTDKSDIQLVNKVERTLKINIE